MTLWLALTGLVLVLVPGSPATRRAATLARAGRLAPVHAPTSTLPGAAVARWGRLWCRTGAGGVALSALALGWLGAGPALGVAAAAVAVTAWRLAWRAVDQRAAAHEREVLRRAIALVAAEFAAGASPAQALAAAAGLGPPFGATFAAAARAVHDGADGTEQLLAGPGPLAPLAHALALAERTGAPLGGVLARLANDLAAEHEQERAVAVALAGPRSSAVLLAGLPLLGIALGAAMAAHPLHFLLAAPSGRLVACAGVLLDVAGVWWVAAVLRRARRS